MLPCAQQAPVRPGDAMPCCARRTCRAVGSATLTQRPQSAQRRQDYGASRKAHDRGSSRLSGLVHRRGPSRIARRCRESLVMIDEPSGRTLSKDHAGGTGQKSQVNNLVFFSVSLWLFFIANSYRRHAFPLADGILDARNADSSEFRAPHVVRGVGGAAARQTATVASGPMPVERSARPCKEPRQSLSSALAAENTKAAKPGGQQHQRGWLGHGSKVEIRAEVDWVKGSSSSVSSRGPTQAVGGNTANVCDRGVGRQPGNYGVNRRRIGADVLGDEVGRTGRRRDRGYRPRRHPRSGRGRPARRP
jgi:hypothetical protein